MNKNIFIVAGILAVVGLLVLILFTLSKKAPQPIDVPVQYSTTTPLGVVDTSATLSVTDVSGKNLKVKNFLLDAETAKDPKNAGYFYLGNHFPFDGAVVSENANFPYTIFYISSTNYFNISLLKEPLADSRLQAEQYLVQHLGIPKEQLCSLQYIVSTPRYVNERLAGDSLGFSFCPGATPL